MSTAGEEERDLGSESLFTEALENDRKMNYLGNPMVIETLIRTLVYDAVQTMKAPTNVMRMNSIERLIKRTAKILLGSSSKFIPMRNWNQPGAIDEFVAKWAGSSESVPLNRMSHALIQLLNSVFELGKYADDPDVLKEHWDWQADALIQKYVDLFLGIDPVARAVEQLGIEPPQDLSSTEEFENEMFEGEKNCGIGSGGFQPGNTCARGENGGFDSDVEFKDGYPVISYQGKSVRESFSEDEIEQIENEVGDIDTAIFGIAVGTRYSSDDLDGIDNDVASKVNTISEQLRHKLEHIPGGTPFVKQDEDSFVRISRKELTESDLHENHKSSLWVDDGEATSTRSGMSVVRSVDDLVDYFAGSQGSSLARGAWFKDTVISELKGSKSTDKPFEEDYGENLIIPKSIVQQRKLEDTDFLSKLAKRVRQKDSGEGLIVYDGTRDQFVRMGLDGSGKVSYSDY